jgi:hypothetical protein
VDKLTEFLAALHGIPATGTGVTLSWGVFKLLEKWLDHRYAANAAERDRDEHKEANDAKELEAMRERFVPLIEKATKADLLEKQVEKLERQNEAKDKIIYEQGIEIRQLQSVSHSSMLYVKLFDNKEGHAFIQQRLKEQAEAKREKEGMES